MKKTNITLCEKGLKLRSSLDEAMLAYDKEEKANPTVSFNERKIEFKTSIDKKNACLDAYTNHIEECEECI